jgi:hypothetical protein
VRERWDFRSVEGALYSLGRPAEPRIAQARPSTGSHTPAPAGAPPASRVIDRADFSIAVTRSLSEDEVQDVKAHYILGVQRLSGRSGYRRRADIINKLVDRLNNLDRNG